MRTNQDLKTFVEGVSAGDDSTLQALRAAATVSALGTSLLIAATDAAHGHDAAHESREPTTRSTLRDTRRALLDLLDEPTPGPDEMVLQLIGSEREFVPSQCSRGLLQADEFDLCGGLALRLEQEVAQIGVSPSASE